MQKTMIEADAAASRETLLKVAHDNFLAFTKAGWIVDSYVPLALEARTLTEACAEISVTDESQTKEMARARRARLDLKDLRGRLEKTRETLKLDSLITGKVVDGIARLIKQQIEPVEAAMLENEEFAIRAERARADERRQRRAKELAPYVASTDAYDLAGLGDEEFAMLLAGAKQAKIDAERRAEEQRIAAEAAEAARVERERLLAVENERLRKEREEAAAAQKIKDDEARKEREKLQKDAAEAKAKADKLEAEQKAAAALKAKQEREAAEKAQADARRAENASDVEKLRGYIEAIRAVPVPSLKAHDVTAAVLEGVSVQVRFVESLIKRIDGGVR